MKEHTSTLSGRIEHNSAPYVIELTHGGRVLASASIYSKKIADKYLKSLRKQYKAASTDTALIMKQGGEILEEARK